MFSLCHSVDHVSDEVCEWQPMMGADGSVVAFNPFSQERRCGEDALRVLGHLTPPWHVDREKLNPGPIGPRFEMLA